MVPRGVLRRETTTVASSRLFLQEECKCIRGGSKQQGPWGDALFRGSTSRATGELRKLHSDQGTELNDQLGKKQCEMYRVEKRRTTTYAPRSERVVSRDSNRSKTVWRALKAHERDNWDELLPYVFMA